AGIGGYAPDIELQADDLRHVRDTVLTIIAELTLDRRLGTGYAGRFVEGFGYARLPNAAEQLIDPLCGLAERIGAAGG
ncbi:hypothetical protein ACWDNR_25015, partial [Gordonia aichiensis]